MKQFWFTGILVATISGCSGSSNDITLPDPIPITPTAPEPQSPPEINSSQAFSGALVQPGSAQVEQFLKNGIYASSTNSPIFFTLEVDAAATTQSSESGGGFSTTTTQEQGVDEADRIEYDGNYMFVAAQPEWQPEGTVPAQIRILERNEDFSLTEVSALELPESAQNINGIYLGDSRLSVLSGGFPIMALAEISILPYGDYKTDVEVGIYDTSQPASTELISNITIEGWLVSSRRIGDQLYLVTAYSPTVNDLTIAPAEDAQKIENYETILATPIEDLMPSYTVGETSRPLHQAEDCFIPEAATDRDGFSQIISVIRINTQNPEDMSALCMSSLADLAYVSTESLYLASTLDNATALHKVGLSSELSYQASGSVEGVLGWNGQPQLRLSEQDNFLRIVSSDYRGADPEHRLTVLEQSGTDLSTVAILPNEQQSEAIGKPGEDIFAVRFIEDKAYIVTFERIDPLYVIDLADNRNPSIAGSLEIPGFSSYLHPLENDYLLGVGQEVELVAFTTDPEPIGETETDPEDPTDTEDPTDPENPTDPTDPDDPTDPEEPVEPINSVVLQGMKVTLFDVSDPANPVEVNTITKENSYTPVEYDYRALSVLSNGNQYQFAMPMEEWPVSDGIGITLWNPINSLLLLDVDTTPGAGALEERTQLSLEQDPKNYYFGGQDRSVIHGDNVYYLHGNQVWLGKWEAGSELQGPY